MVEERPRQPLSPEVAKVRKSQADVAVDALFDSLREAMVRGERIEFRAIGVFQVKPRKRGIGRQSPHGSRSDDPAGAHRALQTGQRAARSRPVSFPPFPSWVDRPTLQSRRGAAYRRIWINIVLAAATVLTTAWTGGVYSALGERALRMMSSAVGRVCSWAWRFPGGRGCPTPGRHDVLVATKWGHYLACRRHGVDATLRISSRRAAVSATPDAVRHAGAVIRIRSPIPSRRVLFDIGVAGPLAGFVVALPILVAPASSKPPWSLPLRPRTAGSTSATRCDVPAGPLAAAEARHMEWRSARCSSRAGSECWATAMNLIRRGQLDGATSFTLSTVAGTRRRTRGGRFSVRPRGDALHPVRASLPWLLWAFVVLWIGRRHPPLPCYESSLVGAAGRSRSRPRSSCARVHAAPHHLTP